MRENVIQQKSFEFALRIILLSSKLRQERDYVLSKQLLRAGTSIGANVEEAQAAQSRRDFRSKMAIASKEARETRYGLQEARETHYGLRLIDASDLYAHDIRGELEEVEELIRILTSIVKSAGGSQ